MGTTGMQRCELCKAKARVRCESDRASLCWDCDAKVHSANFLVARHSRNLLCRVCQSPTPWSAAGAKLGATVSICEECVDREECDDSGGEESAEELAVAEESQIVPWSPPPPEESSSSIEDAVSGGDELVSRKRSRIENDSSNFQSEEDHNCATSHPNFCYPTPPDMAVTFSKTKTTPPRRKMQRTESVGGCGSEILDRVPEEEMDPGEETTEFRSSSEQPI